MSKQKRQIKKYRGLGFVEALLAIIVAGIASVLLMGVAVDTIKQVIKTDRIDEMTQLAIEGGEMVKNVAQKNNESTEVLFPKIDGNQGGCFELSASTSDPAFVTNGDGSITPKCNYDAGQRSQCSANSTITSSGNFRVFCMTNESDSASGLVVGKVVVGQILCTDSASCSTPDYEYYVLTKTAQR